MSIKGLYAALVLVIFLLIVGAFSCEPRPVSKEAVVPEVKTDENSIYARPEPVEVREYNGEATPLTGDFDILTPGGYSRRQLESVLSGEGHKRMLAYIDGFMKAEEAYGVNALYLLCQFGLESGWGRYMAGENNIAGWTDDDGSYRDFESVEDCIFHVARCLSTTYKDAVGSRLSDVCGRYCPNEGYEQVLLSIMGERLEKMEKY